MQLISAKIVYTRLGGQGDPLGIVQEINFGHTNKWYMQNPKSALDNETHKILRNFEI